MESAATQTSSRGLARRQGTIVGRYLEALAANKPKRGRKRTVESINKRLAAIDTEMVEVAALKRLKLVQERLDLEAELVARNDVIDISELESGFVEVAAAYGASQGISYAAWKEAGVDPAVLKEAGITR